LSETQDIFNNNISKLDSQSAKHIREAICQVTKEYANNFKLLLKMKGILNGVAEISGSYSTNDAMEKIVNTICGLLSCDRATVFILDRVNEILWSTVAKGALRIEIPYNKGLAGAVVMNKEPVNIKNAYQDPRFDKSNDIRTGYKTQSVLAIPIYNDHQEIIGVIQSINKISQSPNQTSYFSIVDEGVLKNISKFAGVILKNALMRDEQIHLLDDLKKV
jgi:adenylate cyclase